jgi:L-amino acid N-acyltransferase YncA
MIRSVTLQDAKPIAEIYNYYILHTVATFEVDILSEKDMENRLKAHDTTYPWIVLEDSGIRGYAYASRWKARVDAILESWKDWKIGRA